MSEGQAVPHPRPPKQDPELQHGSHRSSNRHGDEGVRCKIPPTDFVEVGKQRVDATIAAQTELLDKFKEMNDAWLARVQSEADLAPELTTNLIAARSLPDATAAWQEWANKRMSLLAEDGKRLVADGQKVAETGVRLCCNGWAPGGST